VRRCAEGDLFNVGNGRCVRRRVATTAVLGPAMALESDTTPAKPAPQGTAAVHAYAGVQKVFESDGALALELSVTDKWFRLSGTLTRFFERQPYQSDPLTMTMPALALGLRVSDRDNTRVYLEAGVTGAYTRNDPMGMDSSINGGLAGAHVEHTLSSRTTLLGDARLLAFEDDVRGASLRAGVRYRHVQASFSVLDFNIGPALFGPEIGVGF
jgi:hypothetical protein